MIRHSLNLSALGLAACSDATGETTESAIRVDSVVASELIGVAIYDPDKIDHTLTEKVMRLQNRKTRFECPHVESGVAPRVHQLAANRDGTQIYAATSVGLLVSNDEGGVFEVHTTEHGLASNVINTVHVAHGRVYAGTAKGLSISADGGLSFVTRTSSATALIDNHINRVTSRGNRLYIVSDWGLTISDDYGETFTAAHTSSWWDGYMRKLSFTFAYADDDFVYIGTNDMQGKGLASRDGARFFQWNSIPSVNAVYVAHEEVFTAHSGGLHLSSKTQGSIRTLTSMNGLGSNTVQDVTGTGRYVFAATTQGLSVSSDFGLHFRTFDSTYFLPSANVTAVLLAGSTVVVGTDAGLARL